MITGLSSSDLTEILKNLSYIGAYVIAICSLLSSCAPTPLSKDDPDGSYKSRIRKSDLYKIYYKIVNLCGSNIGWAKNLSSPKAAIIISDIIRGSFDKQALGSLIELAEDTAKAKEAESIADAPITAITNHLHNDGNHL